MIICLNAEGVHDQKKFWNPYSRTCLNFLSQMKIPSLRCLMSNVGGFLIATISGKTIRCLVSLSHNGSDVFGATWHFLASTSF